jgi:hypothetical protein
MNVIPGIDDNEVSHLSKEIVNEQWTVHCTPSLTNETGYSPVLQQPTCSTTCKKNPSGPQTTTDLLQRETASSSHIQHIEGLSGGSCTQHDGGIANERHLNLNVKHKEKLTKLSVGL